MSECERVRSKERECEGNVKELPKRNTKKMSRKKEKCVPDFGSDAERVIVRSTVGA